MIAKIEGCPPASSLAGDVAAAFRFVFASADPRNFQAPAEIRALRGKPKRPETCSDHALSFYDTEEHARTAFAELLKSYKKAREAIGTHVAQGSVKQSDGLMTPVEAEGHFDLFLATGSDINGRFRMIGGAL